MAQDDSVQQKFQDILSHVEDVGLPEGEYLKVCNALRDIFKQVPEDKGSTFRNKRVQNMPLPDSLPTIFLLNPTHAVNCDQWCITFEKLQKIQFEERGYDGEFYLHTQHCYHLNIEARTNGVLSTKKVTFVTGLPEQKDNWQFKRIFSPFDPKQIDVLIDGITTHYDVKKMIRSTWKEVKDDYEDYCEQQREEGNEPDDFEDWCSNNGCEECPPSPTDIYSTIFWDQMTHIKNQIQLKEVERYKFMMGR